MADLAAPATPVSVPTHALIAFFLLTYAITWGVVGIYIAAPEWAGSRFGEISGSHPFFFIATWAPAISALAIVLFYGGATGLRSFLSRLLMWRLPLGGGVAIVFGIPVVFMIGSLVKGGPVIAPVPPEGAAALVAVLFMMLFLGPNEEMGWRGVAQPLLQRHMAPLWAGIVIGAIWGIWHLPAFFLSGTVFAGWSFLPFLIGNITLAVLITPIFNASRGSLLWPVLFHWQLINPIWPDAQPYDTWILVVVAVVVVWWKRETMLSRKAAVTEVIPGFGGALR